MLSKTDPLSFTGECGYARLAALLSSNGGSGDPTSDTMQCFSRSTIFVKLASIDNINGTCIGGGDITILSELSYVLSLGW